MLPGSSAPAKLPLLLEREVTAMIVFKTRAQLWGVAGSLAMLMLVAWADPIAAQTPGIVRVEEDWEMVVGESSANSDAPQVTCVISPLGNVDSLHATFVVNHHDVPTYVAGGLQLQAWNGDALLVSKRAPNQAVLATPGETIRWTQLMEISDNKLSFDIINGHSTTWGDFGGDGTLKATVTTNLANLNAYSPDVSVAESGVSYASNRVQSLVLKRIRAYDASGTMLEDTTPRVVHALNE
jgi:hypothetical protein